MKKNLIAVFVFALCLSAVGLTGCSQHRLMQEDLVDMGFVYEVVFDLAGGKIGERETSILQVKDNSYLPQPGSTPLIAAPVREGYTLNAYYRGEKDENGNITYGERWDFAKDRVTSDLTLYAKWNENYSLVVHYGENFSKSKQFSVSQSSEGEPKPVNSLNLSDVTVVAYYADQAKTQEITLPYTPPCTAENIQCHIYAETLDGNWKIIKTAGDFSIYSATNVYFMADIDFKGEEISFPDNYSGKFYGNGYKMSNFKVVRELKNKYDVSAGLFTELSSDAEIKDITFENAELEVSLLNPVVTDYYAGMLAGRAAEGVVLQNVTVSGTFRCIIVEQLFDKTQVSSFIGNLPETVDISTCDDSGVVIDKQKNN